MESQRASQDHLYPLDVLRFCAAFAVMMFHLCFYDWASRDAVVARMFVDSATFEPLAPFTWFGWVGVEIFFVISGFVIANSANGTAPITFLKGRLLRLYPAVWVCATVTFAVWILVAARPFGDALEPYLRSLALWVKGPWIDGVYWSLSVEIIFYALVFWVLVARRLVSLTTIPWVLIALSSLHFAIRAAPGFADAIPAPVLARVWPNMEVLLLRHGAFFAVGIWLWLLSRREMTPLRFAGLGVALALGGWEVSLRAAEVAGNEVDYLGALPAWEPVVAWLAGVGVIVAAARAPRWFEVRSPARRAALKRIGLMTYPLFLAHAVMGAGLMRAMIDAGFNPWFALATAIVSVVAFAYVVCAGPEAAIRRVMRWGLDLVEARFRRIAPGFLFVGGKDLALR